MLRQNRSRSAKALSIESKVEATGAVAGAAASLGLALAAEGALRLPRSRVAMTGPSRCYVPGKICGEGSCRWLANVVACLCKQRGRRLCFAAKSRRDSKRLVPRSDALVSKSKIDEQRGQNLADSRQGHPIATHVKHLLRQGHAHTAGYTKSTTAFSLVTHHFQPIEVVVPEQGQVLLWWLHTTRIVIVQP